MNTKFTFFITNRSKSSYASRMHYLSIKNSENNIKTIFSQLCSTFSSWHKIDVSFYSASETNHIKTFENKL